MNIEDLKPGMKVVVIDERLNCGSSGDQFGAPETGFGPIAGCEGIVVAVQPDVPGKLVAVCFKKKLPGNQGHVCDGLVPDSLRGHGYWLRPEHLYSVDEHKAHVQACAERAGQLEASKRLIEDYLSE